MRTYRRTDSPEEQVRKSMIDSLSPNFAKARRLTELPMWIASTTEMFTTLPVCATPNNEQEEPILALCRNESELP
jgi:hypothetical protein